MNLKNTWYAGCILLLLQACTSSDAYLEQGRALLKEGKTREAIAALNGAVEADEENAEALNTRGVAYFEQKEYSNAQLDYDQAIQVAPNFYRPYYNRALLKIAQNDLEGALKDYSDAIRLVPDTARLASSDLYLNRGQLFATQSQVQPAITDFTKAIELNPKNALALYNRGNLYFNQKNLPGALADFQKSVEADPAFGKAFYGLGLAQLLNNQRDAACLSLKQSKQLGYADAVNAVAQYCP
ncbi:tetratricopeptide repeat protein [Rudanella paleaurantiibacter]|uniref:Tetratricopeptide repeat protein n=1 Tax=Rudanella paleaurantiibacter TaxID=2614655 RepID=A0A7J5TW84_9BACT|nr:tetratricopeptide repeat protein [Rudanella paleaurantiibacter]KAB7727512.1 tetratricopeptide repeat protein [Rudanella paleaurantiibacter]